MLNRVGSSKTSLTQSADRRQAAARPGPSTNSPHPTGPAPPFEYGEEPAQTDAEAASRKRHPHPLPKRG